MKRLCTIYRSPNVDGMYLYVDLKDDLRRVPQALLEHFGKPQLAMKMALDPNRKLARADINKVIQSLDEAGFYLQMPPEKEDYLLDLHRERLSGDVNGGEG
jgi:uncharacterized protein YcgL (UPF0745 family)